MNWRKRAFCVTHKVNPEIFEDYMNQETALAICQRCPVRPECLDYALALVPKPEGVWGGTTFSDRENIKRGGHRASCPGCGESQIFNDGVAEICLSCGVSWRT